MVWCDDFGNLGQEHAGARQSIGRGLSKSPCRVQLSLLESRQAWNHGHGRHWRQAPGLSADQRAARL